jgi:phosphoribosylanthranilate isomerase
MWGWGKDSKSLHRKNLLLEQTLSLVLRHIDHIVHIYKLTTFNKLTTLIKASRVAHLTDARYFAAKEVDYLGFNLEAGTEGYLDPMYMKAIREWVEGPKIVGEFSRTPIRVVSEAATFYGLDVVQVSAKNYGSDLAELEGLEVILELEVGPAGLLFSKSELLVFASQVDVFLFNFSGVDVSKSTFYAEKDLWRDLFSIRPSLLQADIPAEDWPEILEALGLAGLSIVGGEEEKVGVKSYDQIDDIFESLGRD